MVVPDPEAACLAVKGKKLSQVLAAWPWARSSDPGHHHHNTSGTLGATPTTLAEGPRDHMYHHNLACPPQTTHPVITLPLAQPGKAVLFLFFVFLVFYNDDAKNCTGDGPDMGKNIWFCSFCIFSGAYLRRQLVRR